MMILKKFNGLFEVTVEMKDGTNERIGEFKSVDVALEQYVKAVKKLLNLVIDKRTIEVFEAIQHPQYKMIRIR